MKLSKNFHLKEFMPDYIYAKWGDACIWFLDKRIVSISQALRDEFGAITINGGGYNFSGFRDPSCTVGGKLSQHRFGRAVDLKFADHDVQYVYQAIKLNETKWMNEGITTMENINFTPSWLHVDCRWTNMNKIKIVTP